MNKYEIMFGGNPAYRGLQLWNTFKKPRQLEANARFKTFSIESKNLFITRILLG